MQDNYIQVLGVIGYRVQGLERSESLYMVEDLVINSASIDPASASRDVRSLLMAAAGCRAVGP